MNTHRTITTGYLLPRAAALAILVAIAGCDADRHADDVSERPADSSLTAPPKPELADDGAADSRADYAGRGISNQGPPGTGDQSVAEKSGEAMGNGEDSPVESATARIRPTSLGQATGTVTFVAGEGDRGMRVIVELEGLEPGRHGIHIHETGDCSADDASSAGGHFDPYDAPHGSPERAEHHVGDMGNMEADDEGRVATELTFKHLGFSGPASILDKAVVIHSGKDDLESQPAGDAGSRIGCGVIRMGNKTPAQ